LPLKDFSLFFPLLIAYGIAIAIAAWFVVRVERRKLWQQKIQVILQRASGVFSTTFGSVNRGTNAVQSGMRGAGTSLSQAFVQHRKLLWISLAILVIPIVLAVLIKPTRSLEGYSDTPQTTDPVILALLQGEQLVPPPSLPPELFITKEVEAVRQDLSGASREWMLLDNEFRQRLLTIFQLMEKRGYKMAFLEGYRSPERQSYLASLGTQVTNVGAYQSYHQYGLASDCAFLRDGKLVISEKDPWAMEGYRLFGEYAESIGLAWGGRWKMMDFGHIELRKANVLGKR
jgi:peptidoglycan L-alanyl-D-glutamate endopeptidase CwlK